MYVHALPIDLPSPSRCSAELHNLQCKANNLNVAIRPPTSNSHPRVSTPPRDLTTLVLASEKAAPTSQAQPINLLYFVQNSTPTTKRSKHRLRGWRSYVCSTCLSSSSSSEHMQQPLEAPHQA